MVKELVNGARVLASTQMKHLTQSCGVSYVPCRAKVVDVLAVRLVKQGTETTRFRTGSPLHLCQYVYMQASMII